MKRPFFFLVIAVFSVFGAYAQFDSTLYKLQLTGDFRFRVEQDWDSKRADGTYRKDRSRFRYRTRLGFNYQHNRWARFGLRLRTGRSTHPQDPQVTLGRNSEFGILPVSLEKLFFEVNYKGFSGWAGKNTFPFKKQHELFWSDNVYPDGIYISKKFEGKSKVLESLKIGAGHFVVSSGGESFRQDRYFQGVQLLSTHWSGRAEFFPTLYYFRKMPDIPDDAGTFDINYSILQLAGRLKVVKRPAVSVAMDYYVNLEDYGGNDSIPEALRNEKEGFIGGLIVGNFKEKGDWTVRAYYTYLQRFAAVDFFAQNDWTRWDYSGQGTPAGRLTNFRGVELMLGYVIAKNLRVNTRYFMVDQIIPYGSTRETGSRIRVDLDVGF